MNEAIENVCASQRTTLRGRRAPARLPCQDIDSVGKVPVPPAVPGDFTVLLGAVISARTLRELEKALAALGVAGPLTLLS